MSYRPTAKTEAHRAAQHESLLKAATAIVAAGGFQALTISQLAKTAGVATGTVYKYFTSKARLCSEVFKLATEKEVNKVRDASFPALVAPCRDRMLDAVTTFAERAILSGRLAYALIAEPVDPAVEAERLIYRKAYADIYQRLIEEGIAKGEFPPQTASVSAAALVGGLAEALVVPLGQGLPTAEQPGLIKAIKQFCLRAIGG